jgi:hypothetical protein
MPRPQRIEYENAFYHVMDRGREWQGVAGSGTRYSMEMNIISAFWKHLHRLSYVLNALFMLIA